VSETLDIVLDKEEVDVTFPEVSSVEDLSLEDVRNLILSGGLWHSFCEYPIKRMPKLDRVPPAIYVCLDDDEPFHPEAEVYIKGKVDDLKYGLSILKKLTEGPVYVSISHGNWRMKSLVARLATHVIEGHYPANDPGVFLYHNKGSAYENSSWGIRGQDVMRIARLVRDGVYPYEKIAVVGGDKVNNPTHGRVREGSLVSDLLEHRVFDEPVCMLVGGFFRGRKTDMKGSLGYQDDALNVIAERFPAQTFPSFRLGKDVASVSKGFFSSFFSEKPKKISSELQDLPQHCIGCDACSSVCPVDILPQVVMQHLYFGEQKQAIRHGLLDCVSCGLCTYVCPSKIDLSQVLDSALESLV
jgi:Na+-transporting NADH:ubiquinone oxidoreductase subunit A